MLYLNLPEEVETTRFLPLLSPSSVIVPYCVGNDLRLFRLESLEELQPQTMGILEPKAELVEIADRKFEPKNLDLVLVPGLGFDLEGQRIGRGGGFYDRFLAELPQNVLKIALAFETQLLPSGRIPVEKHDQRVDTIVTENRAILCR